MRVSSGTRQLALAACALLLTACDARRIVAVDPKLDGPLGQLIALPDLTRALEQQLNDQLAAQGRHVTAARIEQGALIVTIEG